MSDAIKAQKEDWIERAEKFLQKREIQDSIVKAIIEPITIFMTHNLGSKETIKLSEDILNLCEKIAESVSADKCAYRH